MDASFKLTRQEIAAAYDAGRDAVIALVEGLIERQEQRLAALEQELQELKQDSHDSGKPPSRDSFARKQLKRRSSRRERTDKRQPGGQPEHPGTTLRQAEQPDRVTIHAVERCGCGRSLVDEPVAEWERRQVFDVPPMQVEVEVSEHRAAFAQAGASTIAAHRTGRAVFPHPALGRDHAFAHGRLAVRCARRARPMSFHRRSSEKRTYFPARTLCSTGRSFLKR